MTSVLLIENSSQSQNLASPKTRATYVLDKINRFCQSNTSLDILKTSWKESDRSTRQAGQRYMPQVQTAPELPLLSLFNPYLSSKSIHSLAKLVIENTGHIGQIHQEILFPNSNM
jgi:hypothetical protein